MKVDFFLKCDFRELIEADIPENDFIITEIDLSEPKDFVLIKAT